MAVTINGTTGVAVPLGSASAPAETNTTSSTTGIYYPTSTTLGLSTNGTNAVYIDASQNVGIGTATPAASLSITKQTTTLSGTGNAYGVYIYPTSSGLAYVDAVTSTSGNTSLGFRTYNNGTYNDAVRIDSSGNLVVGVTSATAKLTVTGGGSGPTAYLKQTTLGSYAGLFDSVINTATYYLVSFLANGTQTGSIVSNGTLTTYATSSDVRLKENIVDAPSALPTLAELQVRSFDWKSGPHHKFGLIAQEVVEVDPNAVAKGPTENDMWAIDNSVLVPMLVKAIQELSTEVEALKAKVGA